MADTFRKIYKSLRPESSNLILKIKLHAELLESLILKINNREMSLAMTNLEQCVFWATKAVALEDEQQGVN